MESTGVDVNDITTSDKNLNAAKKLTTVIDNSGISSVTKKTDSNGKVSFTDLAQGMYLVEEKRQRFLWDVFSIFSCDSIYGRWTELDL